MLVAMARSRRSSSSSVTGDSQSMPALETTMSMRPKCFRVSSYEVAQVSGGGDIALDGEGLAAGLGNGASPSRGCRQRRTSATRTVRKRRRWCGRRRLPALRPRRRPGISGVLCRGCRRLRWLLSLQGSCLRPHLNSLPEGEGTFHCEPSPGERGLFIARPGGSRGW